MKRKARVKLNFAAAVLLIIGFTSLMLFYGSDAVVEFIGVRNSYLVMFLIALFGGMTSIGGVSYTASIITFVSGGANPLIIALMAGLGTSIGDSVYYLASLHGSHLLEEGWFKNKMDKLQNWLDKQSEKVKFSFIYIYTGFFPFPNDVLTISLGLSQVRKRTVIPALILGDTTFAFLLAYLGNNLGFLL